MSHATLEDRAKRKRTEYSSSDSQNESCSEESKSKRRKHKHERSSVKKKKKHKKEKKKSSNKKTKQDKKLHKRHKSLSKSSPDAEDIVGPKMAAVTEPTIVQRSLGPMTKEQYEKKQSTMRRIFDEDTGRYRLVRGDGEIVEEIVSKQRQQQINKMATAGDGMSFQSGLTQFYK